MKDPNSLLDRVSANVITLSKKEQRQAARRRDRILRRVSKRSSPLQGSLVTLLRQRRRENLRVMTQQLSGYAVHLERYEGLLPSQVDRLLRHLRASMRAALPPHVYCVTCKALARVLKARSRLASPYQVPITAFDTHGKPIRPQGHHRWRPSHATTQWLDEERP